ncbi:MAG: hypothetical protein P1P84_15650 [Deferrisomatales bacterium]|nr:hypothetical protein [Deferrisomatales bacterium]
MERIFWVECPNCSTRWYADWQMRTAKHDMVCPHCSKEFPVDEAAWIDERDRP